jgi:hypothetical protein
LREIGGVVEEKMGRKAILRGRKLKNCGKFGGENGSDGDQSGNLKGKLKKNVGENDGKASEIHEN